MKLLILSDLHANTAALEKMSAQFAAADAVLFAGDFARFGAPETALPSLEALHKKHDTIFAVIGNCDEPELLPELEKRDMSVQNAVVQHEGLVFAGSGGGSKFTGTTPNERSDEELAADFSLIQHEGQHWHNLIVLMHNPPKDTACDTIANGAHVGSALLRQFIETAEPLVVVTGHIHESAAIDTVGSTTIINPGALLEDRYAWLELKKTEAGWNVAKASLETL
ncbi:MAG: metallophosphoesterase family protein [Treponema sp.]|nr:metallophosphoesterase family protein [Treponema sp.]